MAKLTHNELKELTAEANGTTLREDGGLWGKVRARADGSVSVAFYYRFRWEGKTPDTPCGTWPKRSLATIRAARDKARLLVLAGQNPNDQRRIAEQDAKDAAAARLAEIERLKTENLNVDDLFKAWLEDGVTRMDGNAELQRSFDRDILPAIGTKPVRELDEHHLRTVLRAIVARGVNRTAVVAHRNVLQMIRWAEKRQPWRKLLANGNPAALIEIEKIVSPDYDLNHASSRRLSVDEIRELRDIFAKMQDDYDTAPDRRAMTRPVLATTQLAIWISLSTACRIGELLQAEWAHVDMAARTWFIPKANVKGGVRKGRDQLVSMSDFTYRQFDSLKALTGEQRWLFPATDPENHVCLKSVTKQISDRQFSFKNRKKLSNRMNDDTLVLGQGKNGAWTPHDLRRTAATMMQELGVPPDTIDRCQGHVIGGSKVRKHYLLYEYADEKKEAWRLLGERLEAILAADNVVPIGRSVTAA